MQSYGSDEEEDCENNENDGKMTRPSDATSPKVLQRVFKAYYL